MWHKWQQKEKQNERTKKKKEKQKNETKKTDQTHNDIQLSKMKNPHIWADGLFAMLRFLFCIRAMRIKCFD